MNFVAIDVETANPKRSSICQIGVATFSEGKLSREWSTFVNPEDEFNGRNVSIHGIDQPMVIESPKLPHVAEHLRELLTNAISVCYSDFDRNALEQAYVKYGLPPITTSWVDAAAVARYTWPEFSPEGYALPIVCRKLGYEFRHHDALEDAKAVGHVLLAALRSSKYSLHDWTNLPTSQTWTDEASSSWKHSDRGSAFPPRASLYPQTETRQGSPNGPLSGEVLVITGNLHLPKAQAADLAASLGCEVARAVTKRTTILVVGTTDPSQTAPGCKTGNHQKAETYIAKGLRIRILSETEFYSLIQR